MIGPLIYIIGASLESNTSCAKLKTIELLHRHFDLVTLGDHKLFSSTLLKWTGWEEIEMPRTNVYKKELEFTKKEVENFVKKLQANGDIEFIDQVKKEYYDYLSYLNR